jgi:thiol-disulfide isomerase/thioredoxin
MKNIIAVLIALSLCYSLTAQKTGSFVIKGKAKNHPQDFWELYISNFIGYRRISVQIDKNNNFVKTIPLTHPQDVNLDLTEDGISFFAVPGDIIEINWDYKQFDNSFKLLSPKPERQQELNLMMELSRKLPLTEKFSDSLYDKTIADQVKFEAVKSRFSSQVQLALMYPLTENSRKIFCDLYFKNIRLLYDANLLKKFPLLFNSVVPKTVIDELDLKLLDPKNINESLFNVSDQYRDFIFDDVRLNFLFTSWINVDSRPPTDNKNFTLRDCYAGGAFLYMTPTILDWYLTQAIIFGFERYSFEGSEEAYQTFFPKIKTQVYRDTLERFHTAIQRLKTGTPAPAFSLKDDKGKVISLNDLKGKVVYIDFWSKYCAPCLRAIKEEVPELHKKYRDKNVAFVNIGLDATEKEWKEMLGELKLGGINLWIEENDDPVCLAYNINAVPHYILIDQDGKIVQSNAEHPWQLLEKEKNVIDKLLE